MSKHTQGKWSVRQEDGRFYVVSDADSSVMREYRSAHPECKSFRGVTISQSHVSYNGGGKEFGPSELISEDEVKANAHLIATAPELLGALSTSVRMVDAILSDLASIKGWAQYVERVKAENDTYRAAIARATA